MTGHTKARKRHQHEYPCEHEARLDPRRRSRKSPDACLSVVYARGWVVRLAQTANRDAFRPFGAFAGGWNLRRSEAAREEPVSRYQNEADPSLVEPSGAIPFAGKESCGAAGARRAFVANALAGHDAVKMTKALAGLGPARRAEASTSHERRCQTARGLTRRRPERLQRS
jgi:hypothetical protein